MQAHDSDPQKILSSTITTIYIQKTEKTLWITFCFKIFDEED